MAHDMSKAAANASEWPTRIVDRRPTPSDQLVDTFNDLRDELVSTLWYVLGDRHEAQEAARATFQKCWETRQDLEHTPNARTWILFVALNVARARQRSAWHRRARQSGQANSLSATSDPPVNDQQLQENRLRLAIHNLRQDEKEVFLLRQNSNLTFEEIASIRRSPVGVSREQMRAALAKLRQYLT